MKWTGKPQTGVPEGDGYTLTGNVGTAVGKYTAEAALSDPVNMVWKDGTTAPKQISWSIEKDDGPAAPTALTGIAPTSEANDDGIISGCSPEMEYSLTPDFSLPIPCTGTQITGLPAGTYYVRYRETDTHKHGEPAAVIVPPYNAPDPAAAPVFSPAGGSYTGPQSVTITCATEGAVIYYTTDGSEPTVNSPVYSGPIPVSENLTIKAFAVKDGMTDSPVVTAVYTIIPVPETYTVTVTTDGRGKAGASLMPENVSKGPDDTQVSGPTDTKVSLSYEPYPGYQFRNWQVEPETGTLTGNTYFIGTANVTITAFFETIPGPGPEPEPEPLPFFRLFGELPKTGLTAPKGETMPLSVNYKPSNMELQIPGLNVISKIVTVPQTDEGYPVEGLGMDAGLPERFPLPGAGISVLAGHNTLNAEEFGPFAAIQQLNKGDHFFVRDAKGKLMSYEVYANEKIGSHDADALERTASLYENTLTLLTCEDELPGGGYASRRIVSAKLTGK